MKNTRILDVSPISAVAFDSFEKFEILKSCTCVIFKNLNQSIANHINCSMEYHYSLECVQGFNNYLCCPFFSV